MSPSLAGASGVPHAGQLGRHHERTRVVPAAGRPPGRAPRGSRRRPCAAPPCRRSARPCARPRARCAAWPGRPWTPATLTGSSTANGVTRPVRPTLTRMSSSLVVTSSGGYLKAIAQRGARLVDPSRRWMDDLVDLDHHAVDLVLDVVPVLGVVGDVVRARRPGPATSPPPVAGRQPPRPQRLVGLGLGLRRRSPRRAPMPCTTRRSGRRGGDPRILLAQAAGGGVARVGERRLALLDQRGVEVGERRATGK